MGLVFTLLLRSRSLPRVRPREATLSTTAAGGALGSMGHGAMAESANRATLADQGRVATTRTGRVQPNSWRRLWSSFLISWEARLDHPRLRLLQHLSIPSPTFWVPVSDRPSLLLLYQLFPRVLCQTF